MTNPEINKIYCGDALKVLKQWPNEFVDCVITSPPYWGLRDYGISGQLGLEKTPEEYAAKMVEIFREVKRVLKKEGTCWLNLGDSYAGGGRGGGTEKQDSNKGTLDMPDSIVPKGLKQKDLVGIPWRVAFALQADGWYLRQDIIWAKPNPMPESITDRCTKSHEYIFLLAKNPKYYFDNEAIREEPKPWNDGWMRAPKSGKHRLTDGYKVVNEKHYAEIKGANKRSVWTITTKPFKEAHFATFPEDLIVPMVLAGCLKEGIVLDPFIGSGTTAVVAQKLGRKYLGIELNPKYIKMAEKRLRQEILL